MLIKHGVDNNRDERREESAGAYFRNEYEQRAGLENGAVKFVSICIAYSFKTKGRMKG